MDNIEKILAYNKEFVAKEEYKNFRPVSILIKRLRFLLVWILV